MYDADFWMLKEHEQHEIEITRDFDTEVRRMEIKCVSCGEKILLERRHPDHEYLTE